MHRARTLIACALAAAGFAHGQPKAPAPPPREAPADAAPQEMDLKPAMAAATAWLALVDAGLYGRSWEEGAALFREQVERVPWERMLQDARGVLGPLASRKLASATYTQAPAGAPPGEYVIIRYHSNFANRALTTEIVTPMRDRDGVWRVSGYFIR